MKDEWACLIIWILFLGAIFLFVLYLQWDSKRDERKEKAEDERIRNCKHRNGFTIVKVFGHPDLRECVDCGSIFEEKILILYLCTSQKKDRLYIAMAILLWWMMIE